MFQFLAVLAVAGALLLGSPARAEPPAVEAYGALPAIEQVSLAPSGQRLAYVSVDGEARKLVVVNIPRMTVATTSALGTAKVVGLSWAGDDHLLITASYTVKLGPEFNLPKYELVNVLSLNLQTGKAFLVLRGHEDLVAQNVEGQYGAAQVNGRWYGYFGAVNYGQAGYLDHGWADLWRVDLDTGALVLAAQGSESSDGWLVGPDGTVIARTSYDEHSGAWKVQTGGSGGRTLASGVSKLGGISSLARGRTASSIVFAPPITDEATLQELPLSGATPAPPPLKEDEVLVDPVSGLWIGTLKDGDLPTPHFFDPTLDVRAKAVLDGVPGLSVTLLDHTSSLSRMIIRTTGLGDAGTYWLVDVATLKVELIGRKYPKVPSDAVGPIKMVDWKATDGQPLRGVLSLPPRRSPRNLPLIVMPHGGPEARDYPDFDWWPQLFASRGYAVFQPNFRGSSGYGQPLRNAGFGQFGRKMQTDISDGVAMLAAEGVIDPKRVCIIGWSYGGYAAQMGVTSQHGLYRCAVSMAGLSDLNAFLDYVALKAGDESDAVRYWEKFMGVTSRSARELKEISPLRLADRVDAPMLLIHGKDDTVSPVEQTEQMARALTAAGKPVETVFLPGADHWLLHAETRQAMARASIAFVLKHNPPDPEAEPSSATLDAKPAPSP